MTTLEASDKSRKAPSERSALLMNIGAVLAWSFAPPMIHAVTESFSVNFQNSFRYLVALVLLWPVYLLTASRELRVDQFRLLRRHLPHILVIALTTYGFQVCYTFSLFLVSPSVMALVNQTQVIFGVLFGVLLFSDERSVMRRPSSLVGLAGSLAGVMLVVGGSGSFGSPQLSVGVAVILASACCWALLGALLRKWLFEIPPILAVSSVFSCVTPLFILTTVIAHGGIQIPAASPTQWLILLLSGLVSIGLGHSLFYSAVPVLGVSISTTIGLSLPLLTSLESYLAFGETLTPLQLAGAAVLLGGSFLIVRARFRTIGSPAGRIRARRR